ncbi:MAG: TRAP transporter permease [Lachnospiraceae bacterium]|nr:TRAP transporter permease [Lachnospiraceae bacterium]
MASDIDEVMKKYDRESNTRIWTGMPKTITTAVMCLFSLYCIWSTLFSTAALEIRLTLFLGGVIIMGYLYYPSSKRHVKPNRMPWYDWVIMLVGASCFFYYAIRYPVLSRTLTSATKMTTLHTVIGIIGLLTVFELCRRCVGVPILCVLGALLIYTFATGLPIKRLIYTLFFSTGGVIGTPAQVCAKFIVVFIVFGAFLERTGISAFFIDLANKVAGWAAGGPAKVAVISSALCGMVSGSSVGNTVTTGSVTIPMMKKTGYRPEFAGAVEAAASTGGQIMPPIMGAAAFLMAEYMGIPYAQVALKAILPAVLYFTGIFIAVHLEAKKMNLKGLPKSQLTPWKKLLAQVYLLLPLIILVWLVSTNKRTMAFAAAVSIVAAIAVGLPGIFLREKETAGAGSSFVAKGIKEAGHTILSSLEAGGRGTITVAVACGVAGCIAGCITATGLASKLITGIVAVSRNSVFIALFLTMLCCIVLGMGVPTTANYCIMASTCAPILIKMGLPAVCAHFFVFYFGIVADITPPVALAAYAGSAIAKSNPMKTGVNATKLAIAAFIVPYIFAYSPALLFENLSGWWQVLQIAATSIIGIFGVAACLNGFLFRKIPIVLRVVILAGGLALMYPSTITDIIGIVVVGAVVAIQLLLSKRSAAAA